MNEDPWTDPDPPPGDFDAVPADIVSRYVEVHEGDPRAKLRILISVEGDDVERLERARGERLDDVVTELQRDADGPRCSARWSGAG